MINVQMIKLGAFFCVYSEHRAHNALILHAIVVALWAKRMLSAFAVGVFNSLRSKGPLKIGVASADANRGNGIRINKFNLDAFQAF